MAYNAQEQQQRLEEELTRVTVFLQHAAPAATRLRLQHKQQRIAQALQRLQEGSYGFCRQCGHPIGLTRLAALPYVEACLACQQKQEQQ